MKPQWETVYEDQTEDRVIVRVMKLGARYSMQIGREHRDKPGKLTPYVPLRRDNTKLAEAIQRAIEWVREDSQKVAHVDFRKKRLHG